MKNYLVKSVIKRKLNKIPRRHKYFHDQFFVNQNQISIYHRSTHKVDIFKNQPKYHQILII